MMESLHYLHLQLRLEGKEVINEVFMREVEAIPGEELPLMLVAQLATGSLVAYYDGALAHDLHETLAASFIEIEFPKIEPLLNVLQSQRIPFDVRHYKTYVFPVKLAKDMEVECLSNDDSRVKTFGFDGFAKQVYSLEQDGKIVSACVSTRENDKCGEAWVFTGPPYRHQGFAERVVNAWAGSLMGAGKVPFYSHKIDNPASANLARKLGLQPVFEEVVIIRA
jgi:RimJ/RimL family protein N-acetyltransferase